jgi:hypothetical protein
LHDILQQEKRLKRRGCEAPHNIIWQHIIGQKSLLRPLTLSMLPFPSRYKMQDANFSIFFPQQYPKFFSAHHHRGPVGAFSQASEVVVIPSVIAHTDP